MAKFSFGLAFAGVALCAIAVAQSSQAPPGKPTEHLIGTVSTADPSAHTITVKEDKSGTETLILLADTKTLLKVPPGAKDLKSATRITSDQLAAGDRVDIRGFKATGDPSKIAARSVVLMSASDLQVAHEAQAAEWQHATAGVVTDIDSTSGKITIRERTAQGPTQVILRTSPQTEFTRYSPERSGRASSSELAQIHSGDQVQVIGDKSPDGTTIAVRKIYSAAFRTLNGTVMSIRADGKQLTLKDLATKKPVEILLGDNTNIHKLPPELAMRLAHRLNPSARQGGPPAGSAGQREPVPTGTGAPPQEGLRGPRNGDISQMIERLPKINLADLKPGDAVVVSGVATSGSNGQLDATNIIAGVEPILQSAPARQGGQALGGDWGLSQIEAPQQ
jgi:hypothetical protein